MLVMHCWQIDEKPVTLGAYGCVYKRRALHKVTAPPNMPPSIITQSQLENVVKGLNMTTNTLEIIADSIQTPFLGAIINTTQAVLQNIQVSRVGEALIRVKLSGTLDC
jgi:hypothetical protein